VKLISIKASIQKRKGRDSEKFLWRFDHRRDSIALKVAQVSNLVIGKNMMMGDIG
jgi:hypothetical protein